MKLSYREKIAFLIFTVLVIIIIFVAWPIKLIRADIVTHEKQQETVQKEYDDNKSKIKEIPFINDSIKKVYDESKEYSKIFIVSKKNFQADQYLQDILNKEGAYQKDGKNLIEVTGQFKIDDAANEELEFYYYTPNVVVYPILEAADINGNLMESQDKVLYDKVQNALSIEALEAQEVEKHVVTVDVRFKKPSLMTFVDQLKELDTGVRITGVTIEDSWFGLLSEKPEEQGYSNGTITYCFYTMQQVDEPDLS